MHHSSTQNCPEEKWRLWNSFQSAMTRAVPASRVPYPPHSPLAPLHILALLADASTCLSSNSPKHSPDLCLSPLTASNLDSSVTSSWRNSLVRISKVCNMLLPWTSLSSSPTLFLNSTYHFIIRHNLLFYLLSVPSSKPPRAGFRCVLLSVVSPAFGTQYLLSETPRSQVIQFPHHVSIRYSSPAAKINLNLLLCS